MEKITKENTPNKYVRWLCYVLLFKYVWDIQTLFEKYLPMEKIYRFIGFYIFWLVWFILFLVIFRALSTTNSVSGLGINVSLVTLNSEFQKYFLFIK